MSEASSELEKKCANMEHEANSLRQQLAQNVSNMSAKDDLLKVSLYLAVELWHSPPFSYRNMKST